MDKMDFQISLLVPCYNAEKFLYNFITHLSTLECCFNEVIFFDDGSTDKTSELLKSSGYEYIVSDINYGPGYARNRLAEQANCDYIHFHDIDDEFNPSFLNIVKKTIELNQPDLILGYADWIDQQTKEIIIRWEYNIHDIEKDPLTYFITHPLGIINTVYKRQCFLNENGFNEKMNCWEDADLNIRLAASKIKISVIPDVIAYSLRHNSGISKDQKWCWNCRLRFLDSYIQMYSKSVTKNVFKKEIKNVQSAFIINGDYIRLIDIHTINKKHNLGLNTNKIKIIYYLNKYLLPSPIIRKFLYYLDILKRFKK